MGRSVKARVVVVAIEVDGSEVDVPSPPPPRRVVSDRSPSRSVVWLDPVGSVSRGLSSFWVRRNRAATTPRASRPVASFTQPAEITGFWTNVPVTRIGSDPV